MERSTFFRKWSQYCHQKSWQRVLRYDLGQERLYSEVKKDKDVNFDKDLLPDLKGKNNRLFESLKGREMITRKSLSTSVLSLRKSTI